MTIILTKLVWGILQATPGPIISQTYSLIFIGVFLLVLLEKELVRIISPEKFEEGKNIFNLFIILLLILLVFVVITLFVPFIFDPK